VEVNGAFGSIRASPLIEGDELCRGRHPGGGGRRLKSSAQWIHKLKLAEEGGPITLLYSAHYPVHHNPAQQGGNLGGVTMMRNTIRAAVTVACLLGMASLTSLAASAFEGVWKVKDTAGQPFEITLSSDGVAKATRGEGMTGTWKEEGMAAVITWNTGWTTKITKDGNQYKKTAYRKGQALDALPANSSDAERVK